MVGARNPFELEEPLETVPTRSFTSHRSVACGLAATSLFSRPRAKEGLMSASHKQPRKKRGSNVSLGMLEERQLLSAGMGSAFAIIPGSVTTAGQVTTVQFKIDPSLFTAGKGGKILLGLDVAADPSSNIKPEILSITTASGRLAAQGPH